MSKKIREGCGYFVILLLSIFMLIFLGLTYVIMSYCTLTQLLYAIYAFGGVVVISGILSIFINFKLPESNEEKYESELDKFEKENVNE